MPANQTRTATPVKTGPAAGKLRQGQHPDPLDPDVPRPDRSSWSARQRRVFVGPEMHEYRAALRLDYAYDVRSSVLDDLSKHFDIPPDECVKRCLDWEAWCVAEWEEMSRESPDAIRDFYKTTRATAFDVLWYAYLQSEGFCYPVSAAIAATLPPPPPGAHHLDFGSGAGVTSQLFQRLGYETALADVSTTLLDFAAFRFARRGQAATFIDLNTTLLPERRYDVITAIDVLVHVPDLAATVAMLHRALKPGGVLFANFDVRPMTPENAWHLYENDLPLRWRLQRAGFEPEESLDGMITRYRRVEPEGLPHLARGVRDAVLLRSPARPAYRMLRASVQSWVRRLNPGARAAASR